MKGHAESDALHAAVRSAINRPGARAEDFTELFLEVAAFQARQVEPIARLTGGVPPRALSEIVALPTQVFQRARVAAHEPSDDVAIFRTSGTTSGNAARGAHPFRSLATYESAAIAWAKGHLFFAPLPARALILAKPSAKLTDSSLSFMIDLFVRRFGLEATYAVDADGAPQTPDIEGFLGRADPRPVIIFGTSFAYVAATDAMTDATKRGAPALPPASRIMITGGFKGRSRTVEPAELRRSLIRSFGEARIIGEYGMTELSSQLYETGEPDVYRAPPWVRVEAVSPVTLHPVTEGELGIARILDLANIDSSLGIQTEDQIRRRPNGDIELHGRLPGAEARGCSLLLEELLGS